MKTRLAIVLSHPVQYYAPWFRHLAAREELRLKVFYLWDFGVKETRDRSFGTVFVWDIPMLEGYDSEFLPNRSKDPGTHHFRGLDNPGAVRALAAWKPDAVLLFGYNYQTHIRLLLSHKLSGIRFFFRGDSHELVPRTYWRNRLGLQLRRLVFKRFFGFLAVGKANQGYLDLSLVPRRKIHLVPHCVDNDRFQTVAIEAEADALAWRRDLGLPADAVVVLFAGKFEGRKCPLDLLEAFLGLKQVRSVEDEGEETSSDPSCLGSGFTKPVLLFVGNGSLEKALREAAGPSLGQSVFFAPFQNQLAMPKVYATGDLLVLPSFSETWGLAVNEAMNLARPAIVSSHVGCGPDLIIPGETGWIFEAGNVEALRDCLADALADPARLKSMGRRAREHLANYSYECATDALCEALKR